MLLRDNEVVMDGGAENMSKMFPPAVGVVTELPAVLLKTFACVTECGEKKI